MKRIASVALTILLILCVTESAFADAATATTMKLEAVTGTVTVKNASGVAQTVRDGMRLYNGYAVSTAAASEAYISLDSSKAVKLGASGKIQIKQSGKQLEVSVSAGELFFNVTAPLKTDESLNVRTSTMVTGVRGSFGWVKPGETGLVHGSVILTRPGAEGSATLSSGQLVRADGRPAPITSADVPTLVAREMRDRPELLEQVKRDVPSVDLDELMTNLDARIAQEREAEAAAQAEIATRHAQETQTQPAKPSEPSGSGSSGGSGSAVRRGSGSSGGGGGSSSGSVAAFYAVAYRDNADGAAFPDETHGNLVYGAATPAYSGGVPTRTGYTFAGWSPTVTPFVVGNAVYTAQWVEAADKPDTPDTPDVPDKPDTPDTPDVPDKPDTPDTPDTPDEPDTPDTPDEPDTPDTPIELTVTATGYSGVYDGQSHGITVAAPAGAAVTYSDAQDGTYQDTSPVYKDAGEYAVYYRVTKDGASPVAGSAVVRIMKATLAPELELVDRHNVSQILNIWTYLTPHGIPKLTVYRESPAALSGLLARVASLFSGGRDVVTDYGVAEYRCRENGADYRIYADSEIETLPVGEYTLRVDIPESRNYYAAFAEASFTPQ